LLLAGVLDDLKLKWVSNNQTPVGSNLGEYYQILDDLKLK
jgi:hypothetical protein